MARGDSTKGKTLNSEKKEPSLASMALDNIPTDALTRRREFVDHLDQLEIDKKAAANEYAAHEKRLTEIYGVDKFVQSAIKKLRKMKTDQRSLVLRQLVFFIKDLDLTDPQLNLFNDDGQPGGMAKDPEDKGAVFDKGGSKAAPKTSEREPVKKLTGAEPPPHVPTPGIPLDEAKARFEEANAKGEEKRAAAPKHEPEVIAAAPKPGSALPKPPTPTKGGASAKSSAAPKPPVPAARSASAVAKDSTRRMSRAPTPSEAAAVADKYIPKAASGDAPKDDDEGDAPGNYRIH